MAVSVNLGYVASFNLSETIDETLAINNLGGGSISDDLSVFSGNTKNVSRIIYKPGLSNFSIVDTGISTKFKFDLISCYGNGDPIVIKSGKTISTITYDISDDSLTVVFDTAHNLQINDIGSEIQIFNSYFNGPGTVFFNEKPYRISNILNATSIKISNTGYTDVYTDPPGTFSKTINLSIGASERYTYATTEAFDLPSPLVYGTEYYIAFSDAINSFQITEFFRRGLLITAIRITDPVTNPLIFERKNIVTQRNLLNLVRPDFQDDRDNVDAIYNNSVLQRSFNQNFDYLESTLDGANFFRLKKYKRSASNTFDENPIKIEGDLKTLDPDNANTGTEKIFTETSPGIFIIDPSSTKDNIVKLRSFSDNTSPWELNGNVLEYSAQSLVTPNGGVTQSQALAGQTMSIGNLILKGGINPIAIDNLQNIIAENGNLKPSQKFTHKLPVIINGEEYNILLTNLIS
jgi:hypothetical protein